jgi:hypothetical protein
MNRISAALATVAVLALAGCGRSGTSAGPSSTETTQGVSVSAPAVAPKAKYGSVSDLHDAAVAAGYTCPSWTQDNVVTLAAESGHCSDADVFTTYASAGQLEEAVSTRKGMNELLTKNNVAASPTLVGENWMINGDAVTDLQPELGGTILR